MKPLTSASETSRNRLVSVIMPCFNTAAYIQEAIDSVLAQDYPYKELIVIDDGSNDDTLDVVRGYGDRLKLITQNNQGSAVARNQGLNVAQGDYIAFLDSDDVWLPGKLTAQVSYLERHSDVQMVFARWQVWKPDQNGQFPPALSQLPALEQTQQNTTDSVVAERSGWLYNRLLFSSLLHTITVLARRDLIERVGLFDTSLKRGQDYDYWIRASRITQIHQLDRIFALYRIHGAGCVRRWPEHNYEKLVVEKAIRQYGLIGPNGDRTPSRKIQNRLAESSFSFGYHHVWEGQPNIALKAFLESLAQWPWQTRAWAYLILAAFKSTFRQ